MHSSLAIWIGAGLAVALLGAGGYHYEMTRSPSSTPLTAMAPGEPPPSTPIAATSPICVELARPQADDQGHYVPVPRHEDTSVMGYASAPHPVKQVVVNGVPADTYAADYQPYGTPAGYSTCGFQVPLTLAPDTALEVAVTDADGYQQTIAFQPDRVRTYNRVHEMWVTTPDNPYSCVRLANTFTVLGDFDDAYPMYHRCLTANAGFHIGSFYLGLSLFDTGRYDDAWTEFHRCTVAAPSFYPAYYGLGECYRARGYDDYAIQQFQWVTRRDPKFVEANLSLGEIYSKRNDWGHAESQYRQVLNRDPKFASAHVGLGEALTHQGKWDAAGTELKTAQRLNPEDARPRTYLASAQAHQQPTHIAQFGSRRLATRQYAGVSGPNETGVGPRATTTEHGASTVPATTEHPQPTRGYTPPRPSETGPVHEALPRRDEPTPGPAPTRVRSGESRPITSHGSTGSSTHSEALPGHAPSGGGGRPAGGGEGRAPGEKGHSEGHG